MSEFLFVDPNTIDIAHHLQLTDAITHVSESANAHGAFVLQASFSEAVTSQLVDYADAVVTTATERLQTPRKQHDLVYEMTKGGSAAIGSVREKHGEIENSIRVGLEQSFPTIQRGRRPLSAVLAANRGGPQSTSILHRDDGQDVSVVICPNPFEVDFYLSKFQCQAPRYETRMSVAAEAAIIGIRGPHYRFIGRLGVWHQFFNRSRSSQRHSIAVSAETGSGI